MRMLYIGLIIALYAVSIAETVPIIPSANHTQPDDITAPTLESEMIDSIPSMTSTRSIATSPVGSENYMEHLNRKTDSAYMEGNIDGSSDQDSEYDADVCEELEGKVMKEFFDSMTGRDVGEPSTTFTSSIATGTGNEIEYLKGENDYSLMEGNIDGFSDQDSEYDADICEQLEGKVMKEFFDSMTGRDVGEPSTTSTSFIATVATGTGNEIEHLKGKTDYSLMEGNIDGFSVENSEYDADVYAQLEGNVMKEFFESMTERDVGEPSMTSTNSITTVATGTENETQRLKRETDSAYMEDKTDGSSDQDSEYDEDVCMEVKYKEIEEFFETMTGRDVGEPSMASTSSSATVASGANSARLNQFTRDPDCGQLEGKTDYCGGQVSRNDDGCCREVEWNGTDMFCVCRIRRQVVHPSRMSNNNHNGSWIVYLFVIYAFLIISLIVFVSLVFIFKILCLLKYLFW